MTYDLRYLAEDPGLYLAPPESGERIVDEQFCVTIDSGRSWAGVCRLQLPDGASAVADAVTEILDLLHGVPKTIWNVGSSAHPADLHERLVALGLSHPDPPLDPVCAAMILTSEPARVEGVDVRRIETLEDHLVGLEILLGGDTWPPDVEADKRAHAEESFDRHRRRGDLQWLATIDGVPLAWAKAERAAAGLFLGGGATLPAGRGRGCYRALVRARWDEAVRLGLPGLAVQAQYKSSVPILRRLGFAEVATIHTLQS